MLVNVLKLIVSFALRGFAFGPRIRRHSLPFGRRHPWCLPIWADRPANAAEKGNTR
jgi:hypothetical protein